MNEPTWTAELAPFVNAAVGHVRMVSETDPTPDGWYPCDGSTLRSSDYPQFARAMGIQEDASFTLPEQRRSLPGRRFIVKLGRQS